MAGAGAVVVVFFFKQKTAYEIRPRDWSSDVCSSDLGCAPTGEVEGAPNVGARHPAASVLPVLMPYTSNGAAKAAKPVTGTFLESRQRRATRTTIRTRGNTQIVIGLCLGLHKSKKLQAANRQGGLFETFATR